MIVPMFLSAILNSFFPEMFEIGKFTRAIFTSQGVNTIVGITLMCTAAQISLADLSLVLKRGGVLFFFKWAIATVLGLVVNYFFGMEGIMGISVIALMTATMCPNNSINLALNLEYGDRIDQAAIGPMSLLANPFMMFLTVTVTGLSDIPIKFLIDILVPLVIGFIIGNTDENARAFLKTGLTFLRPFLGFALGASINILSILYGGISGIILALIQILIAAPLLVLADRKVNKRPGYAAWSMGATAVISIATPQLIAEVDPTFIPYVQTATTQVATSVVLTALLVPIIVTRWVGKYGKSEY